MRKLKKKQVTNQAPKTSGEPVQIYTSPEEQFGLPVTPSVDPLINTGYTDYDLDPFYDNPRIRELRAANDAMLQQSRQDYNEYVWNKKIEEYYENFTKAKKTDKVPPLETLPIDNLTPELEQELKAQGFFINKTKTEAQLFPADIIQKRVIEDGFRENQFSKYWGLDSKEVKEQYKDLFDAADKQYEATILNKVLTESIKQGKSPKEIFNNLPKSWGVTSELKKRYLDKSEKELQNIIDQTNKQLAETTSDYSKSKGWNWLFEGTNNPDETFERTYYTKEDGTPDWEKMKARSERIEKAIKEFQKSNPDFDINSKPFDVIYKDDGSGLPDYEKMNEQALKYNMFQNAIQEASSEPFRKVREEYTSPHAQEVALTIAQRKLAEAQAKNDYAGEAKILNALQNNKLNEIFSNEEFSNELSGILKKRSEDYKWNRNVQNMSPFDNEPLSTGEKIWDVLTYPQVAFGYSARGNLSDMWAGNMLYGDKWEIAQQTGDYSGLDNRNIVGNFLNTYNPIRLGAESRKNYDAGRYGQLALDVGISTLPFWGGSALKGVGQGVGKVLRYAPIKSMPWLNLQNAVIDPYFLYESVRPGGYFSEAYKDFSEGEIASGLGNTAFGAMGVLPYVKPAVNTLKTIKSLSKPGYEGQLFSSLPGGYGLKYTAPSSSTLTFGAAPKMQTAEEFNAAVQEWRLTPEGKAFTRAFNKEFHPNTLNFQNLSQEEQAFAEAAAQRYSNFKKGENIFEPGVQFINGKLVKTTQSPVGGFNLGRLGRFDLIKSGQSELGLKEALIDENLLRGTEDLLQTRYSNGLSKTLDTEVPMYRVEPKGVTYPTNKLSSEYMDWDYGPTSEMNAETMNQLLKNPNALKYVDETGVERIGNFFPQHTVGNWWSSVPMGTLGAPDYVAARFAELGNKPVINLTTNVPFSQLNRFSVKNDPQAMQYVGIPDKEFILPNEFKQKATINYRSGVPSSTGRTGITGDNSQQANYWSARKAFEQDLKTDSDYKEFIENSKIPEEQQTRRLNDSYDIPGRVLDSYGVPLATKDYKNFQTPLEINSNVKGSAGDIIEAEVLGEGNFTPTNDEIVTQLADDIRTRKIERWQSPEGQRRLQQMIDNTPSLQGLTPDDYIETMIKINVWNRQRNNATTELASAKEELQKLQEEHSYIYGDMYDSGQTPSKELVDELTLKEELIKTKIDNLDNTLSSLDAAFPHNIGYWEPGTQTVAIDPSKITAEDARLILGHELAGHVLGSPKQTGATVLDDALSKIDLIDDEEIINRVMDAAPTIGQVSIMYNEPSGANEAFGPKGFGENYLDKSIEYWKTGSGGTEKVPFAAEVVEDMLAKGLIKSEYDKITPDLIKKHYNDYMNNRGDKYPLRLYDIMQGKNKNFKILSDVMNNLPTIAGAAIAADAILGDGENKEEDVTNAGLLMLFGRFGKPGKSLTNFISKLKSSTGTVSKGVLNAANNLVKNGYDALTGKDKKLLQELIDLEQVRLEEQLAGKNLTLSEITPYGDRITPVNTVILQNYIDAWKGPKYNRLLNKLENKLLKDFKNNKLDQKTIDRYVNLGNRYGDNMSEEKAFERGVIDSFRSVFVDINKEGVGSKLIDELYKTDKEIDAIKTLIEDYTKRGIRKKGDSWRTGGISIKEAEKELIRLTNKKAQITQDISNYTLRNEKIYEGLTSEAPWLSKSIKTGKDSLMDFTTGEVLSTEVDVSGNAIAYTLSKDLKDGDAISKAMETVPKVLEPEYLNALNNNINFSLEKLPGAKPFGSSILVTEAGVPHFSKDIDFIMIDTDFAKVSGNLNVLGKAVETSPATQVNIFPDAGEAGIVDVNLILTGSDGLAKDDPNARVGVATQIFRQFFPEEFAKEAALAAAEGRSIKIPFTPQQLMERFDPLEKTIMDAYEARKTEKQIYRPDVIVSYADEASLDKVASGQQKYIKSIVGPNGQLAKQFPEEAFNDPAKNLEILKKINYPGARSAIAKSPKRMQLAINDFYIHQTVYSREIDKVSTTMSTLISKFLPANVNPAVKKNLETIFNALNDWHPKYGGGTAMGIGLNTTKGGDIGKTYEGDIRSHKQLNVTEAFSHPEYSVNMNNPSEYVDEVLYQGGNLFFTPKESKILDDIYNKTVGTIKGRNVRSSGDPDTRIIFPKDILRSDREVSLQGDETLKEQDLYVEFLNKIGEELGLKAITGGLYFSGAQYASTISKVDETVDALLFGTIKKDVIPYVKSWLDRTEGIENLSNIRNLPIDTVKNFKKIKNLLESGVAKVDEQIMKAADIFNVIRSENQELALRYLQKNKKYQDLLSKFGTQTEALKALNEEMNTLREQHKLLQSKIVTIDNYKRNFKRIVAGLISLGVASAGVDYGIDKFNEWEDNRIKDLEFLKKKSFKDRVITPAKEKGKIREINQWLKERNNNVGNPFQWDSLRKEYDLGPPILRRKTGGETGIDLELTQEQINELIKQGYDVVQR